MAKAASAWPLRGSFLPLRVSSGYRRHAGIGINVGDKATPRHSAPTPAAAARLRKFRSGECCCCRLCATNLGSLSRVAMNAIVLPWVSARRLAFARDQAAGGRSIARDGPDISALRSPATIGRRAHERDRPAIRTAAVTPTAKQIANRHRTPGLGRTPTHRVVSDQRSRRLRSSLRRIIR